MTTMKAYPRIWCFHECGDLQAALLPWSHMSVSTWQDIMKARLKRNHAWWCHGKLQLELTIARL